MNADTLINNLKYHKLEKFDENIILNTGLCNRDPVDMYFGAIRQDTALRKVYLVAKDSSHEMLLYDFNLVVGDTIDGYMVADDGSLHRDSAHIVSALDSVLVDGNYRKRWQIGTVRNHSTLIEGVGLLEGLFKKIFSEEVVVEIIDPRLLCMSIGGKTIYPDSLNSCNYITAIEKAEIRKTELTLYPNPFKDNIAVKSDEMIHKLQLYSINGQQIQTIIVDAKSYNWTPKVKAGIYFVKIADRKGNSSIKKLIKYE